MNARYHIILAFGLLLFFAFLIWSPSITGRVASGDSERVVVILRASSSNSITGAVSLKSASFDELKASTAVAQKEVLEDVNKPSLLKRLLKVKGKNAVEAERSLDIVPAMVVDATPEGIEELKVHPLVEAVYPNIEFDLTLAQSVPLINADDVWELKANDISVDGTGVAVCVIDTGILPHTAFQDRIVDQKCYCYPDCCPNGQSEDDVATDTHPVKHGTHVSGIIAANGQYKGVAPGADIVAVKVCGLTCTLADIISGLDYCLQVKDDYNIVAVSGSLGDGGNYDSQELCPTYFDSAINAAFDAGITSVFASGNNGYLNGINYPGCSPNAISVGATDKSDVIASFSNRGALLDVLAPGVSITSTVAGNGFAVLSGTSQATPHVSGLVALIQQFAGLTPAEVKQVLQSTGVLIGSWKRVDALAAVESLLPNTPPVASISSPAEGATLQSPVSFEGSASDAEDGVISSDGLSWSSDVDGLLGTGDSLQSALSIGEHTVTLTATDSGALTDDAVVHISVVESLPNTPPAVSILSPVEDAVVESPVSLQGSAVDAEDGELVGTWKEGESVLGSGNDLSVPLSTGSHSVVFSAVDSESAPGEDSVSFLVKRCHLDVDQNANGGLDIGDLVLLLTKFFNENLECSYGAEPYCVIELDMNKNGNLDIGDFVLLLTGYSQENLKNFEGQFC